MRKHIRHGLDDSPWARVELLLATVDYHVVRRARLSDRELLHAVCWILKTGAPWRDLPHEFGSWQLVYKRFARWRRRGVWDTVFNALTVDADREAAMIDGSYVRAHQASVGGKKQATSASAHRAAVERPRFMVQSTRLAIPCTCISRLGTCMTSSKRHASSPRSGERVRSSLTRATLRMRS